MSKTKDDLATLLGLIHENGSRMLEICSSAGQTYPSIHDPFDPDPKSPAEAIRRVPEMKEKTGLVLAAAKQLVAMLEEPNNTIRETGSFSTVLFFSLKTVVDAHVPEILDEAGTEGMHINEIGKKANVHPQKIGRLLRLLATNFFFKEVRPDVFAHNRTSSLISTGKPADELVRDASRKFEETNGVAVHLSMQGIWGSVAAAEMPNTLLKDPKVKFSDAPGDCSFNQTHGGLSLWEWLGLEENTEYRKMFDIAMATHGKLHPPEALAKAYDWASLPEGSYFVDVGGGMGGVTMGLLKAYTGLEGIVQDLPDAVSNGRKWFSEVLPDALTSGRVTFEVHDFFEPQPPRDKPPAIFLLRLISHDFSDPYLLKIIRNLRRSAGPDTRLLIQDLVLHHACAGEIVPESVRTSDSDESMIPPSPLLRNWGRTIPYLADILMLNNLNGQERTLLQFQRVLKEGGWQLVEMKRAEAIGLHLPLLVAVPDSDGAVES